MQATQTAPKTAAKPTIRNGVNVTALMDTIQAVKADPSIAQFQFRAKNRWLGGGHNRSTIKDFYGAGKEDDLRTEPFVIDNAEPPVLLGEDQGANPVEHVLNALAGCLTTTLAYHAAAQGIEIEQMESELEGDLDLQGFLWLDRSVRPGYRQIRVKMKVRSDADASKLAELAKRSPVFDIVTNPVEVVVDVQK